jgi:cell wall-associated NlpC family hydrolase
MLTSTSSRVAARLIAAPLVLTVMVTGQAFGEAAHAAPAASVTTSNVAPFDAQQDLRELTHGRLVAHELLVEQREQARAERERREAAIGERIVAAAAAQAGKPYVYGATGASAFDCSGLTGWAYAAVGIHLPRTSYEQAAVVTPVSDPAPGDLVFFGGHGSVDHVGIYAGNGQIWHAPHSGDVVRLSTIWTSNVFYGRVR